MWIARDKNEWLGLFRDKPWRNIDVWSSEYMYCVLDRNLFPELKWTDEPVEVELVRV